MSAMEEIAVTERIAKIDRTFLGIEDHGILTAILHCFYGGSGQGVGGYALDGKPPGHGEHRAPSSECGRWVSGVLRACGVDSWEKVAGRTVIVICDGEGFQARPIGIRPLPTERGETFMFAGEEPSSE
jgi:hypothetical protein